MNAAVTIGRHGLDRRSVVAVARDGALVDLGDDAREALAVAAELVARASESTEPVYGVSTGFGSLATTVIPPERREELQRALVRSHAAGMGPPVEDEVVRAMMLLRARTLAMGYSGVRPVVVDTLLGLLNARITPTVPEHGSLGASGDLAPLAHVALALIGEGDTAGALESHGIAPVTLRAKEGLSLINGTDGMLGMLVLALADLDVVLTAIDVTAAMSIEALLGTDRAFAADLMALRPHPGQTTSADNLRRLLDASPIVASHRIDDPRVQDAYSLRCTPQVHGAARDAVTARGPGCRHRAALGDRQPDAASRRSRGVVRPLPRRADRPGVRLPGDRRGRRRFDRRAPDRPAPRPHPIQGLPPFLVEDAGVNSGVMIVQYTQAAMVAENRRLAVPASVDSVPTSAMQEDHVSMGWGAARKLRRAVANLGRIVACELVCAARGLELRAPLAPAPATAAAVGALRAAGVPGAGPDRWQAPELALAERLVMSGELQRAVEAVTGPLA